MVQLQRPEYVTILSYGTRRPYFRQIIYAVVRPCMPNIRKVAASVAAAWDEPPALAPRPKDDRYTWVDRPAVLYIGGKPRALNTVPKIGDVLRLRAPSTTAHEKTTGVVLGTRVRKDGIWTHVNLAFNG